MTRLAAPVCHPADARLPASYAQALGTARADLLLTDPPYCLLTRRRRDGDPREPKGRKIDRGPVGRFESVRDYRSFTEAWLSAAVPFLTPEAPLILWTNFLGKAPLLEVAAKLGYGERVSEFRWCKKTTEGDGNEIPLRIYEVALVLMRVAPPPLGPGDLGPPTAVVGGYDDEGQAARWGSHPNHKPFSVLAPLLRAYSHPGARVLDCFAGSGSIPEAALRLSRWPVALEIEPAWAQRVTERLSLWEQTLNNAGRAAPDI